MPWVTAADRADLVRDRGRHGRRPTIAHRPAARPGRPLGRALLLARRVAGILHGGGELRGRRDRRDGPPRRPRDGRARRDRLGRDRRPGDVGPGPRPGEGGPGLALDPRRGSPRASEPFEALADEWLALASGLLRAAADEPEAPAPGVRAPRGECVRAPGDPGESHRPQRVRLPPLRSGLEAASPDRPSFSSSGRARRRSPKRRSAGWPACASRDSIEAEGPHRMGGQSAKVEGRGALGRQLRAAIPASRVRRRPSSKSTSGR